MVINSLIVNRTKEKNIGFTNIKKGLWMFCNLEGRKEGDAPVTIGPMYATKQELLADSNRYISEYMGY